MNDLRLLCVLSVVFFCCIGCAKSPEERELKQSKDIIEIVFEGIVEPSKEEKLIPPFSEKISAVHVRNGNRVSKGQTLIEYDTYALKAEYRRAVLEYEKTKISSKFDMPNYVEKSELLANARDRILKTYELYKNNSASLSELKNAEDSYLSLLQSELTAQHATRKEASQTSKSRGESAQEVKKARLDVEKARYNLDHARIASSIDGYVTDLKVSRGQAVSSGEMIGKVLNIDSVILKGGFSPGIYRHLRKNMTVDVSCMTTPPYKTKGAIQEIAPVVDSESKRMSLYIPLKNPDYLLQPGDKCLISIVLPATVAEKTGVITEGGKAHIRSKIK